MHLDFGEGGGWKDVVYVEWKDSSRDRFTVVLFSSGDGGKEDHIMK